MGKSVVFLLLFLGLALCLDAAGVRYGMSRTDVEIALGRPVSVLAQGHRVILLYKKGGRIEMENDKVVRILNVPVASETPPQPPAPAATPPKPKPAEPAEPSPFEKEKLESQRQLAAQIEKLTAEQQKGPPGLSPAPAVFWNALVVGLLFRIIVTVVVLKLAFLWSDVHAEWGQLFFPAVADTFTQAAISAVAFAFWNTSRLLFLDQAISYFVLLFVLMKTTHACTLARAIGVVMAAKLASLVLWTFLSVMILNLLH